MKNYIYTKSSTLIAFDEENVTNYNLVPNTYGNVDWMFPIPEDGVFCFDKERTYEVKAGDIVYIMYPAKHSCNGYEREVIVVSCKELYDHYMRCKAQEDEDSNALKSSCDPCCATSELA